MADQPGLTRVRKAWEQVADQLRTLILTGDLRPGHRLPAEHELADNFGVSRTTLREALRALSAEGLIKTTRGALGGSFVSHPNADHISAFLSTNLHLLAHTADVSLQNFLEAREELEVPAARFAAERRTEEDLRLLHGSIVPDLHDATTTEQFELNRSFHAVLVQASANPLLYIAAQPIFMVLQTHLKRSVVGPQEHDIIKAAHVRITAAVERGDADAAETEMRSHFQELRPFYERAWQTFAP